LFCPGAYDTIKMALFKGTFVYPVFIIHSNFSTDRGPVIWENGYFNSLHVQYQWSLKDFDKSQPKVMSPSVLFFVGFFCVKNGEFQTQVMSTWPRWVVSISAV
jgi:hypothetical protein